MKIIVTTLMLLLMSTCLFACNDQKPVESSQIFETDVTPKKENTVLKAWTGEYSEEERKEAIKDYKKNYSSYIVKNTKEDTSFTFEVDHEIASVSVPLISKVDNSNETTELNGYIDLFVDTTYEKNRVSVDISWWYLGVDSLTNKHPLWSYLVCVTDTDSNNHYYYFRADYSEISN